MKTVIWGSVITGGSFVFSAPDFSECPNRSESVRNRKFGIMRISKRGSRKVSQIQFETLLSKSKSKFGVFWDFTIQIQIQIIQNLGACWYPNPNPRSRENSLYPNPNPKLRTQFERGQNGDEMDSSDTWYWVAIILWTFTYAQLQFWYLLQSRMLPNSKAAVFVKVAVLYSRRPVPVCFGQKIKKQKLFFSNFFIIFFSKMFIIFFQKISKKIKKFKTKSPGTVSRHRGTRYRGTRAVWLCRKIPELTFRGDFESDLICFTPVSVSTEFLSFLRTGIAATWAPRATIAGGSQKHWKPVGAGRRFEFRQNPYGTGNQTVFKEDRVIWT